MPSGDTVTDATQTRPPGYRKLLTTPKWVAAENLTRPVIEAVYTGQKPAKVAMEDLARQINALPD